MIAWRIFVCVCNINISFTGHERIASEKLADLTTENFCFIPSVSLIRETSIWVNSLRLLGHQPGANLGGKHFYDTSFFLIWMLN